MTDTETALLAAIAAHPEEDTPRLMLADWLDENVGHSTCPACKGLCGQMRKRYTKGAGGAAEYWENCPTCSGSGSGTVPDDRADRAELIRVQVELARAQCELTRRHPRFSEDWWTWALSTGQLKQAEYGRFKYLHARQSALIYKHPEWRPPCPACEGSGEIDGGHVGVTGCGACQTHGTHPLMDGTGRVNCVFERGFIGRLTVPTLATVLRRFWVCRRGTRHTTDMGICTCCMSREGQWSECEPTPWASDLVRHRDRWPLLREVRVSDRVPYHNGRGYCFYDRDRHDPSGGVPETAEVPLVVYLELAKHASEGSWSERWAWFAAPDAALAALGAAVWRVLVRLAGEQGVKS
jgi:uncharacterized protein (TIGR02996 family)